MELRRAQVREQTRLLWREKESKMNKISQSTFQALKKNTFVRNHNAFQCWSVLNNACGHLCCCCFVVVLNFSSDIWKRKKNWCGLSHLFANRFQSHAIFSSSFSNNEDIHSVNVCIFLSFNFFILFHLNMLLFFFSTTSLMVGLAVLSF